MSVIELPSNRAEHWRWSDLSLLPQFAARPGSGRVPDVLPWLEPEDPGPRLLFVDGVLDAARSRPMDVAIEAVRTPAEDHALARLVTGEGWVLRVGDNDRVGGRVEIVHVTSGGADHLPASIEIAPGARADIVETFIGEGWANRSSRIRLGEGAQLSIARRLLGSDGFVSLFDWADVGARACLRIATLAAGERDSRIEGRLVMDGEAAEVDLAGALLARGRQRHDASIVVHHGKADGESRQIWRSVADDRAACSVAARVEVARDAQKTDAEQSLRGLLLSRGATINAKPELEIFADDVKCAHGATVGELDEDALFYLESRGVPTAEAQAMLTRVFVADAIDLIEDEAVRLALYGDAEAWFG